jgi:hypothetical protein
MVEDISILFLYYSYGFFYQRSHHWGTPLPTSPCAPCPGAEEQMPRFLPIQPLRTHLGVVCLLRVSWRVVAVTDLSL